MKKNEVKVGAILSYVVIVLNMVINLAYTPLLIRKLGQSEYGLYSLVSSIISYLTVLDLGLGNAIIVYTARYRAKKEYEKEKKLHGMFFVIYSIIGIISFIIGIIITANISNLFGKTMTIEEIAIAKKLLFILTINLAVTFSMSIFSSIITAYERFIFSKTINIIRIILNPIIMIPLLMAGAKSVTLVIVISILNITTLLVNTIYCFTKIKIKFKFGRLDVGVFKEITSYSVWIFLNSIIDKVNWSVDQFILGTVSGTIAVSVYSVAAKVNGLYMNFSNAISGVMLPKITKMEANHASDEEFTNVMIKTGRIQLLVLALIMSGYIIFGQQFINYWAGKEYAKAYIIGIILMFPITVPLIQNVGLAILQAKNKYKYRTMIFIFIAIFNVLISIPLAYKLQGIGTAIGTAISEILGQIIILNIYYHKVIHINMIKFWKSMIKIIFPVIVISLLFFTIHNYFWVTSSLKLLIIKIIIYSFLYTFVMWNISMNDYEKNTVKKLLNKIKRK